MACILTGVVASQRILDGMYKDGSRKGEKWEFLSIDIRDPNSGQIFSCQLASDDQSYERATRESLIEHKVRVRIKGQKPDTYQDKNGEQKLQIRTYIKKLEDLGLFEEDE
jgi:hypothetical protein